MNIPVSLSSDGQKPSPIRALKRKLNRFANNIYGVAALAEQSLTDASVTPLFQARLQGAMEAWKDFRTCWDELDELCLEPDAGIEFPDQMARDFYNMVSNEIHSANAHAYAAKMLENAAPSAANNSTALNQSFSRHLPRITLPSFSGNLIEWKSFSDTYKTLVHEDPNLSKIEKFNYLKNALKGEAATLIMKLSVSSDTYDQAWQIVQRAYDNPRVLASFFIRKALEFNPAVGKPTLGSHRAYLRGMVDHIEAFKNLALPDSTDFLLTLIALRGLDSETRREFELSFLDKEFPTSDNVFNYVRNLIKALMLSSDSDGIDNKSSSSKQIPKKFDSSFYKRRNDKKYQGTSFHTSASFDSNSIQKPQFKSKNEKGGNKGNLGKRPNNSHTSKLCAFCQGTHDINQCFKFSDTERNKRMEFVKAWKGCTNCLREGHKTSECKSKFSCKFCNARHHSLLHEEKVQAQESLAIPNTSGSTFHARTSPSAIAGRQVLLGTALIIVKSPKGKVLLARALLDSCSQYTFITDSLAKRLECRPQPFEGHLTGLGGAPLKSPTGALNCCILGGGREFPVTAVLVDQITSAVPACPVPTELIEKVMNCQGELADAGFGRTAPVDVLIGGDLYPRLLTGAPVASEISDIFLLPTVFGSVVLGNTECRQRVKGRTLMTISSHREVETLLERFWEVEEPRSMHHESPMDAYCRKHFEETTFRDKDGRYFVRLPLVPGSEPCGNNRELAARRFFSLERKFRKDPEFRDHYVKFMQEYLDLGHMQEASSASEYLIPHHGIWQRAQSGRKLRVVFDASCPAPPSRPGLRSISLNDTLLKGPKVLLDISDVPTRFRMYTVALVADLVKMYRQIRVHEDQRSLQHIFWRPCESLPLKEMELNTLTYGKGPCAFLAMSTVHKLARDSLKKFPLAAPKVLDSMYMDDFVAGTDSVEEAIKLKDELESLFSSGGFALDKWASNVKEVLPGDGQSDFAVSLNHPGSDTVKILGLVWEPIPDSFSYVFTTPHGEATKRSILSSIARIFDPLGLLVPVILRAKCIVQDIWKANLDWDDKITPEILSRWSKLIEEWSILSSISVPRRVTWPGARRMMIGFSDASENGYAAVVYLRSEGRDGEVQVRLLRARSKVAPTKFTSIARLELCGAFLLARLMSAMTIPECDVRNSRCFTDSAVALAWLKMPPYKLKTFEANRVSSIKEMLPHCEWSHVLSSDNPADVASRGCTPSELKRHQLWWQGPTWLKNPIESWPITHLDQSHRERGLTLLNQVAEENSDCSLETLLERFSSLRSLVRTVARMLRWAAKIKQKNIEAADLKSITADEYRVALRRCVYLSQRRHLPKALYANSVPNSYKGLSPFIDEDGVIRVGGRLKHASLSEDQRHPMLLLQHKEAHLSNLIIRDVHLRHFHPGPTLTLALVRTNFWIKGGLRTVKSFISKCVQCRIRHTKLLQPLMGDLPRERLATFKAFQQTGVDFAGPFLLRESKRRSSPRKMQYLEKAYLCIFICMSSRAVHLECVTSLSTVAFLSALDRFISRRGVPQVIYSDNGSNFIGASRYLKDLFKFLKDHESDIVDHLAPLEVKWSFTPPRSPHFGGSWEAGVKFVKRLLTSSVGVQPFTYEELNTIFTRIEGILNARPLCPMSEDADNWDFLTPGHFISGGITRPLPEVVKDQDVSPRERWELVSSQVEHVWRRWRLEYLHYLQQRTKWKQSERNLKASDLVILGEKRHILGHWPVARVVSTHPGKDSIVRVVTIRTPSGSILKRAVKNLAPLFPPEVPSD